MKTQTHKKYRKQRQHKRVIKGNSIWVNLGLHYPIKSRSGPSRYVSRFFKNAVSDPKKKDISVIEPSVNLSSPVVPDEFYKGFAVPSYVKDAMSTEELLNALKKKRGDFDIEKDRGFNPDTAYRMVRSIYSQDNAANLSWLKRAAIHGGFARKEGHHFRMRDITDGSYFQTTGIKRKIGIKPGTKINVIESRKLVETEVPISISAFGSLFGEKVRCR
jgi:hypothetical protein